MSGFGVTLLHTADVLAISYQYEESILFTYACTVKLVVVLSPLALTLGPALIPGLAELRSSKNVLGMERMTLIYTEIVLAISGFFGCLVVALNSPFVNCWLGGGDTWATRSQSRPSSA